jgi:hypothetical protein
MHSTTHRRLCGALDAGLVLLCGAGVDIVVYAGSHVYERRLDACEPE